MIYPTLNWNGTEMIISYEMTKTVTVVLRVWVVGDGLLRAYCKQIGWCLFGSMFVGWILFVLIAQFHFPIIIITNNNNAE